jgi:hypothetical protein
MKAAKIASQIKRFVHLFGGHVSENTQAFFFRQTLRRAVGGGLRGDLQLLTF